MLILRRPIGVVDDQRGDRTSRRIDLQPKLLLDCRKKRRAGGIGGSCGNFSAELGFVGRPLQIEIVSSAESGLVYHWTIENCALQHGDKFAHRGIAGRQHDLPRVNYADQRRRLTGDPL